MNYVYQITKNPCCISIMWTLPTLHIWRQQFQQKTKILTYHWSVSSTCCGGHWLWCPTGRFCRILWRVPLHSPVTRNEHIKSVSHYHFLTLVTYLTCADADLFIVKFSASDANELSRSPVRTFPVPADWCDCCCCIPPVPMILDVCVGPAAPPETGPGFKTSPSASKPTRRR